jgi:V/A-type H+-transporting ATPase subunit C
MAKRYSPTDYLYTSARIRAVENTMVGREKLTALIELKTVDEIIAALLSLGFVEKASNNGTLDTEAMLLDYFKKGLNTVAESTPDTSLSLPICYPYDNHNIKAYLKCKKRSVPPDDMMIDMGSISLPALTEALDAGRYDILPPNMAHAIPEALEAYAKTNDPREIDFFLDRATFADMAASVEHLPFVRGIIAIKADLTNVLICERVTRLASPELAPALFAKAAVPGGTLSLAFFSPLWEEGAPSLFSLLSSTPYHAILQENDPSLTATELAADNYLTAALSEAKRIPFGAEVPFAYLMALDASVKNLRLLLACKQAGLPSTDIRLKVRDCYV